MNKTKQEVFDIVVKHLFTQKQQSVECEGGRCLYRGPNGLKCAVGVLIKDEDYKVGMEGVAVSGSPFVLNALEKNGIYAKDSMLSMLNALQYIHDSTPYAQQDLQYVKFQITEVAAEHDLTVDDSLFN